jgi:hypothetical protein
LHFHEDPSGLYADIRAPDGGDFDRVKVDGAEAEASLVARASAAVSRVTG